MADVKRSAVTPTVAQAISRIAVANSTTDATSSFALWGGLEAVTGATNADITGAVGTMYICDISGYTVASKTLTLPSASVGERLGVYISVGDPDFELILKGAASQTINGGIATEEWSRLFIQGECVIFRCIAANTWIVEHDGRIPCVGAMRLGTTQTGVVQGAVTAVELDSVEKERGVTCDTSASEWCIRIRRAGDYRVGVIGGPASLNNNNGIGSLTIYLNGAAQFRPARAATHATTSQISSSGVAIAVGLSALDELSLYAFVVNDSSSNESFPGGAASSSTAQRLFAEEIL